MIDPAWLPGRWEPAVRSHLLAAIDAQTTPSPLAVFDWDNTCVAGDVGESTLQWLDRGDGGDRMAHYDALIDAHGKRVGYAWCAEALAGRTEPALRALAWQVWRDGIAAGTIVERPEIRDLIAVLQRRGWAVWVVSASQETLVQVAAQRYGVPAHQVIGVRLATDGDGTLAPRLDGPLTFREGKVEAIDARIGRRPTLAVGDAETDLEMLAAATYGLWIDRGDAALRAHAEERGWWIQPVFEPRDR